MASSDERREAGVRVAAGLAAVPGSAGALAILARLREGGHRGLVCGGCVRDLLLERAAKDIDIVSDAVPARIEELFEKTVPVGVAFGVVQVVIDGVGYEVATFRSDGAYADGRRPSEVRFGSIDEDARRRDFTINALYCDPASRELIDLGGGLADLAARRLRAIGDAHERLGEDYLRMLRAVRFACQLDFELDPSLREAVAAHAGKISAISAERITAELLRIAGGPAPGQGIRLLRELGLLEAIWPDRAWGDLDAAARAGDALAFAPPTAALAALLLAGSPEADEAALERLVLSRQQRQRCEWLLRRAREGEALAAAPVAARKRALREEGGDELLTLLRALALAGDGRLDRVGELERDLARWRREGSLAPAPLLDGKALIEAGVRPGPAIGELLRTLEDLQLSGEVRDRAGAEAWLATALEELA